MSKTLHENAVINAFEAWHAALDALPALDGGGGYIESWIFPQVDIDGNHTETAEGDQSLRGQVVGMSITNITTAIAGGGSATLEVGDGSDVDEFLSATTLADTSANTNDATDADGVLDKSTEIAAIAATADDKNVIPADSPIVFTLADVSTDTGIFDLQVFMRWFT